MKLEGILTTLLIIIKISFISSYDITCEYTPEDFAQIQTQFTCKVTKVVQKSVFISEVTSIIGTNTKTNNDVTGFALIGQTLPEIPSNLSDVFPNLLALKITSAKLEQIQQGDISPWPQLKYLNLDKNEIEVLEENLFTFNRELVVIFFGFNKIKSISGTVFDGMNKLYDLDLSKNVCIDRREQKVGGGGIFKGKTQLMKLIDDAKGKCGSRDKKAEVVTGKLERFEEKVGILRAEGFLEIQKVGKLESDVKNCSKEVFKLKSDVEYLEVNKSSTEDQLRTEIFTINSQLMTLKIAKEDLMDQNEKLTNQIEDLENLRSNFGNSETKFENLTKQLNFEVLKLNESLEECQMNYSIEVKELNENLLEIKSKFDFNELNVENLTKEIENLQILSLHNQTNLNQKMSNLIDENNLLQDEINDKKLEIEKLIQNSGNISEFITQLNGEIYEKETLILDLEGNLTEIQAHHEITVGELKLKLEESETKLIQIRENLKRNEEELLKVKDAKIEVETQLVESAKDVHLCTTKVSELNENYKVKDVKIKNLESKIESLDFEINDKNAKILNLEGKISTLNAKIYNMSTRSLNSNSSDCEIKSQNLADSLTLLYENFQQLEEKAKNLEGLNQKLEDSNQNLTAENQILTSKIEVLSQNHQDILKTLQTLNSTHEKDSQTLNDKLKILLTENEDLRSEIQSQTDSSDNETLPVEYSSLIEENQELKMWKNLILYIALPVCGLITLLNLIIVISCLRKMASYKVEEKVVNVVMDDMQREWVYGL